MFSFRYANFRKPNLESFYDVRFNQLFNEEHLTKDYPLYIKYDDIQHTDANTYNLESKTAVMIFDKDKEIIDQLYSFGKEYIIIKQFWAIYKFKKIIKSIYRDVLPSKKIMDKFEEIKNRILNQPYNFIHYRYENDFMKHFEIKKIYKLSDVIKNLKFKDNNLKIYIATSNIENLPNILIDGHIKDYPNVIYKDEAELVDFNFEEKAFIDFMIGLNAVEIYGHRLSSFSYLLNIQKKTWNFYNFVLN